MKNSSITTFHKYFMKKVKTLFYIILTMAILAGALAFKVKKQQGLCVYQTKFITLDEEIQISICIAIGQYTLSPFPNGTTFKSIFTTQTSCVDISILNAIFKCTLTLTLAIE
ncbi:hypothetical protein D3H65_12515 [Paraflavitalea soli]|uniref:Uncharacterized protein n=1 Tax=Paraflavitalea soli TaxID=2315862 RepID=A0A3B7MSZ3_9BACT|nr:hypothetical protein D3H65_12515 [Paraflavitalea soli]